MQYLIVILCVSRIESSLQCDASKLNTSAYLHLHDPYQLFLPHMGSLTKMSSRKMTVESTHSNDVTKRNQATNMMSHDNNHKTLSGSAHNEKKKRIEGRGAYKYSHSEAVSSGHKIVNTHESGTSTVEAPFDAKIIIPETKAKKSLSPALSSMKKVPDFRI